jgi:23S rRNA pseudouridine2605 synthase
MSMKNGFKADKGSDKRPRKQGGYKPTSKPSAGSGEGKSSYSYRDNPKTFGKPSGGSGNFDRPKPRFDGDKPRENRFEGGNKYQPKSFGSNDRPDRKPYGDRPARSFDDRPKRDFGDKPRFEGGDRKPFGDRPPRSFDDRPKRDFGDKPRFEGGDRKPFGDRPPRSFDDRPKRDFGDKPRFESGDRKPFGDRPPRSFDDRPKRDFGDKPRFEGGDRKPFGDRPPRSFDDRPKRDFGDKPRFGENKPRFEENTERPAGKFDNDKSRFSNTPGRAPRAQYEAPRAPRGPKRFDGPYQKNLNSDTGGAERSNRKDNYRSDGAHFDYESRLKETIEEKNGTIRLNRFIANSGICSRRDADELIEAGQITVNGEVITEMGHQVKPTDAIKYGNKLLTREKMVYLLLNKPKDYITTTEDPQERKTVMNLIEGACKERIYPVGRLDRNTTGLILFTNDGELASKLTHPSNNVEKMYQVEIDKELTEEHYQAILKGITLEDGEIKADSLGIVTPDGMVIGIQIHSGRNHIVRRIFAHLGYEVLKLDRTVFAGLNKKDLPRSKWRFLTEKEVIKLKYLS